MTAAVLAEELRPYVSDLHARWLRDRPERRHRRLRATLVFADISGFTPLTERLARRGRVGAEALTDVLNDVFGELLTVAAAHGGDLLKFGGDALLLYFDGAAQERRACAAAAAMQAALRRWRRLPTEAGTVALQMSVGIAGGQVHAFLVGEQHRELLVAGPVVSRVIALEAAANAGEVLIDPAIAAAVDAAGRGATRGDAVLLGRAPIVEVTSAVRVDVDATVGVPVALREYLGQQGSQGEHRQAVQTFLRFSGVDHLLATAGVRDTADEVDAVIRRVQAACTEHGVYFLATDLAADGAKVLLCAGAPSASPDDADRTLVTLLDVLAQPSALTLSAGVNAGPAFAVDVGSPSRRTYAVMGDATNLAARVMGRAGPGQVVATSAVLERARAGFEHTPLAPFTVKGKAEPVSASVVVGISTGGAGRTPDGAAGLVGRRAESAAIADLLDGARAGRGGGVTLVGEAGIGKSTLVEHGLALAEGLPRLRCVAAPYAASSPYYAVRTPMRALLGLSESSTAEQLGAAVTALAPELADVVPLVGVVLGIATPQTQRTRALAAEFRRARAHEAMDALIAAALPGPAVIVVEDAHWLDDASAALLRHVAGRGVDRGWAVLETTRSATETIAPSTGAQVITLRPLDVSDVHALASRALGEVPRHVRDKLADRSGGNPLFLLALLDAARRGADPDSLPGSLEALVAAGIDALPPGQRTLIRHASVFGHRFTASLLAELTGIDRVALLRELAQVGHVVVRDGRGYRFVHALMRDAAYAALPYRQRRTLHARAGDLIERRHSDRLDEWSDLLSLHYEQAQQHAKTWHFACRAAVRASATWAPAEACALYQRALRAGRALGLDGAQLAATYEELGDCAERAGRYRDAAAAYSQARRLLAGDALVGAELCRKEGWVRERSGSYAAALRWYRRAHRMLDAHAEQRRAPLRAQLALAEGAARLRQGRYRAALPLLHSAVTGALDCDDEQTLAHAYYLLDWAYTDLGHEDALRYRELSLPIYERLGNLGRQGVVLGNLGIDAYVEGRWADAIALYERGRAASVQAGDVVQAATAVNNIGEVYSDQGRIDDAVAMFRDALATWRQAPFPVGVWLATSNLGRAAARAGRFDEAATRYAQARAGFGEIGAQGYVAETAAREVELRVLAGEPDEALATLPRTLDRVRRTGGLAHLALMLTRLHGIALAQADAVIGAGGGSIALLRQALDDARRCEHLFEQALAHDALGQVLDGVDGSRHRAAAATLLGRLGVVHTAPIPALMGRSGLGAPTEDTVITR